MNSADFLYIHFTEGESVAQGLIYGGKALNNTVILMERALAALHDSGLRGTFLAAFQDHSSALVNTVRALADEMSEAGRDLQMVVERARLLDAQVATGWMQGSKVILVDTAGGYGRTAHVSASIARLEELQRNLQTQLADIRQHKGSRMNALLGLHGDYEQMEQQLTDTVTRNQEVIERLQQEQLDIEQTTLSETETGFGRLLRETEIEPLARTSESYAQYVHRQYDTGDTYGCALYAQTSVLEAMGFDFNEALKAARAEGMQEGWYDNLVSDGDGMGTEYWGLGDIFDAHGIQYDRMGASRAWSGAELPASDAALERLHSELHQGNFPVVSFMATEVELYAGQKVEGHTVWVTGLETDSHAQVSSIIANDSHFGRQVMLPVDQFLSGWNTYNYQAVFARPR